MGTSKARTCCDLPCGCHSRPPFFTSPIRSWDIPVCMLVSLSRLAVRLETVSLFLQPFTHQLRGDAMPHLWTFLGECAHTRARPAQH